MIIADIRDALLSNVTLLALVCGPFIVFTVVIHLLERLIQTRLAERFGWKSVLWTGWLGTPVHELSHVAMCLLFRHRVDEVSLFEPDPISGRLGYVRHSWRKGNWFEELGNTFIGIAPLVGGSLALLGLVWLFYPEAVTVTLADSEQPSSSLSTISSSVVSIFSTILQPKNLAGVKFWVFIYLVLCVGAHMAPSWSDYRGAGRGSVLLAVIVLTILALVTVAVSDQNEFQSATIKLLSPLYALFAITALLSAIATLIVVVAVGFFPARYQVR